MTVYLLDMPLPSPSVKTRKSLLDTTGVLVTALKEFPIHQPPNRLWRFLGRMDRSGSTDISALTEGKLNLTPPEFFNDPFEMWVGIATESLTEEVMLRSVSSPSGRAVAPECNAPG